MLSNKWTIIIKIYCCLRQWWLASHNRKFSRLNLTQSSWFTCSFSRYINIPATPAWWHSSRMVLQRDKVPVLKKTHSYFLFPSILFCYWLCALQIHPTFTCPYKVILILLYWVLRVQGKRNEKWRTSIFYDCTGC